MQIRAAITPEKGALFSIETVELDAPKENEVLVKMVATGICHTDISTRDQYKPVPLPAVLGHEGAGIVETVGPAVTKVQPGDHVVLSYGSCGECENCRSTRPYLCESMYRMNFSGRMPDGTVRIHQGETPISAFFGQSSFATHAVVPVRNLVKVEKDIPLQLLAPLGCGVQTGSGVIFNRLKPGNAHSLVVFGCGTVGLSAVLAAKATGCRAIIGVDLNESRLQLAKELGATHTLNPKSVDVVKEVKMLLNGGADFAVDAIGHPRVLRSCVEAIKPGGTAVLVGGTPLGTEVSLDMMQILAGRTVTGVTEGDSVPDTFIPQLISLYKDGRFPFDKLVREYPFEKINEAVHDMESGLTIKPVLVFS